ncbi:MATE family efflux transporter [Steroidobacter gossypii]|uniref:MATE family efflux transporter n=1 Tax=Steroidobacter gossypii TaxID=2805490 RepID=UPI001E2A873C
MKDLTRDRITRLILVMAAPAAVGMLAQIAYQLIDLYFVTQIGVAATAAVGAANNVMFLVLALTQALGVGTLALISQALGRKDLQAASKIFNQSLLLSLIFGALTAALLYVLITPYLQSITEDTATIEAGQSFILWLSPGIALMFPMTVFSSTLRGAGEVSAAVLIYTCSVVANAALAPVLIAGRITGLALGVAGAGLASTISVALGVLVFAVFAHHWKKGPAISLNLTPCIGEWLRILRIGVPAGTELVLTFLSTTIIYYAIRDFGISAQAGFGIAARVLQVILLPAMAIAFAAGPIVGQNFGARNGARVREAFRTAAIIGSALMVAATLLVHWQPEAMLIWFDADADAIAVATQFLRLMSATFIVQALVYTCAVTFQGLGNTKPALASSAARLVALAGPAIWLSEQPRSEIEHVWYVVIAATLLQGVVSCSLLRMELRKRLSFADSTSGPSPELEPSSTTSTGCESLQRKTSDRPIFITEQPTKKEHEGAHELSHRRLGEPVPGK